MDFLFDVGDLVEHSHHRLAGVLFKVVERYRTYDSLPRYDVMYVGPRKLSPVLKGRLHKHFRIKRMRNLSNKCLAPANAMFTLAVFAE